MMQTTKKKMIQNNREKLNQTRIRTFNTYLNSIYIFSTFIIYSIFKLIK